MMPENTNKQHDVLLGETKEGKQIVAYVYPNTGHYAIKCSPGGVVPKDLDGTFTTINDAKRAVDIYLQHKNKEVKNAKSTNG